MAVTNLQKMYPVSINPVLSLSNLLAGLRNHPQEFTEIFRTMTTNNIPCHNTYIHIIQIGAGGTGGYVAAEIMRFLGSIPDQLKYMIKYTLCDGDEFEAKNLGRQLCSEEDLGVNKAEALISNYGPYFGCNMNNLKVLPKYLTNIKELQHLDYGLIRESRQGYNTIYTGKDSIVSDDIQVLREHHEYLSPIYLNSGYALNNKIKIIPIIIDCVDKTTPRKIISDYLDQLYNIKAQSLLAFIIDFVTMMIAHSKTHLEKLKYSTGKTAELYITKSGKLCVKFIGINELTPFGFITDAVTAKLTQPQTYIISSGNGHFTGQVYWGRVSGLHAMTTPVKYKELYGNDDVSPLFGKTTSKEIANDTEMLHIGRLYLDTDSSRPIIKVDTSVTSAGSIDQLEEELKRIYMARQLSNAQLEKTNYDNDNTNNPEIERFIRQGIPVVIDSQTFNIDEDLTKLNTLEELTASIMSVPSPYKVHPELIDISIDAQEDQMSCAERAAANVQNINANKTAANLVINYFTSIINGLLPMEPGSTVPISTAGVKFDVRTNSFTPELLTTDYLRQYT